MSIMLASEEQAALRDAVRRTCTDLADPRALADDQARPRWDPVLWRALAAEMGLTGIMVPEDADGLGGSVADAAIVIEQLGAALAPVPVLSTVALAGPALRLLDDSPVTQQTLKAIAGGETVAALGVADMADPWSVPVQGQGVSLNGSVASGMLPFVLDGAVADVVLVAALSGDEPVLCTVATGQPGVQVTSLPTLDLTRGLARLVLEDAQVDVIGHGSRTWDRFCAGLDIGFVLLCAETVGAAQRCFEQALAYAKQRVQFDRPIGSFQAVKHLLVDLLLDLELARSAMHDAVETADRYLADLTDESARDLRVAASTAAQMCKDTGMRMARETLHVFGGLGFTWEHDAHLYFRRAKSNELLLGTPAAHRARLVAALRGG